MVICEEPEKPYRKLTSCVTCKVSIHRKCNKSNHNKLLNHITLNMNSTWLEADKKFAIGHSQADNMLRIGIEVAVTISSSSRNSFSHD
jgi:hypothetical protein